MAIQIGALFNPPPPFLWIGRGWQHGALTRDGNVPIPPLRRKPFDKMVHPIGGTVGSNFRGFKIRSALKIPAAKDPLNRFRPVAVASSTARPLAPSNCRWRPMPGWMPTSLERVPTRSRWIADRCLICTGKISTSVRCRAQAAFAILAFSPKRLLERQHIPLISKVRVAW